MYDKLSGKMITETMPTDTFDRLENSVDKLLTENIDFEEPKRERPMPKTEKWIWVTFQKEGIHKYPAALEDPKLAAVSFLGYPHRHIFHFRVEVSVTHNDRDIEFILLKRELEALYDEKTLELDYKSCEMMSDDLYKYLRDAYPNREYIIEVSEDGENGSRTRYYKES